MQYTFLGNTGLKVSELCLGAMTFGTEWGWGADEGESRRIFNAFVEAGGNFIDTANAYTNGTSERFIGSFMGDARDRFVVATKYTVSTDAANANGHGNSRKNLIRSLEASLKRLQTDYIDLYFVHMWDAFTPVEEVLRALDDAVRAGKVLHIGFSDFPAWLVARADALAEVSRFTRPAAIQIEYNLAQREAERELIPMAEALGLSVLDWSPLGGGVLTGKTLSGSDTGRVTSGAVGHFDKYRSEHALQVAQGVVEMANELGCSPAQLAIAWLRTKSPIHIPIIGARSAAHIEDNLNAAGIVISDDIMQRLDTLSAIDLGFPMNFYPTGRRGWFGKWPEHIDTRLRPNARRILGLAHTPMD
ncbi:MAG: aldo/keto reductase [Chloroflexota bacterium]|nr:aldo/keto reductase [Chloroflexota bacterium]